MPSLWNINTKNDSIHIYINKGGIGDAKDIIDSLTVLKGTYKLSWERTLLLKEIQLNDALELMRSRFGAAAMWLVIAGIAAVLGASAPSPASAQGRPTRPKIDRPDGAVWQVIRKNCTACHGIDDYAFYAMDKAGWQNLIDTKHKTGTAREPQMS